MLRLADALSDIIGSNPFLQFGLSQKLLNLSQLSRYIQPQVEARTKKEVQPSAILMALSRMQREVSKKNLKRDSISIDHLSIQTGLSTLTFAKSLEAHKAVEKVYASAQKKNAYATVSEGTNQITVILDSAFADKMTDSIQQKPLYRHDNITAISVLFDESFTRDGPGFVALILQQLMLQSINIVELSSTFTELILFVDERDTKLAFETLFRIFEK